MAAHANAPSQIRTKCHRAGCGNTLTGRQTTYCSNACKATDQAAKRRALHESVALDEIRAQVGPAVREVLTDRVLHELQVMTHLVPEALAELQKLVHHEDPTIAQKAIDTILKFTVGHPTAQPKADAATPAVTIQFGGMPQQGDSVAASDGSVLGEAEDVTPQLRRCVECDTEKPAEEFVGESLRCKTCHDEILASVRERFPALLPSGHGEPS